MLGSVEVRRVKAVEAVHGTVRPGGSWRARRGIARCGTARRVIARQAWRCMARRGRARPGGARRVEAGRTSRVMARPGPASQR